MAKMVHELKCSPTFFRAIVDGRKKFEVRRNDRKPRFNVGDGLLLREWTDLAGYTGNTCSAHVTFILDGDLDGALYGVARGHVVMSLDIFAANDLGG